jgi:hypothetical protein
MAGNLSGKQPGSGATVVQGGAVWRVGEAQDQSAEWVGEQQAIAAEQHAHLFVLVADLIDAHARDAR